MILEKSHKGHCVVRHDHVCTLRLERDHRYCTVWSSDMAGPKYHTLSTLQLLSSDFWSSEGMRNYCWLVHPRLSLGCPRQSHKALGGVYLMLLAAVRRYWYLIQCLWWDHSWDNLSQLFSWCQLHFQAFSPFLVFSWGHISGIRRLSSRACNMHGSQFSPDSIFSIGAVALGNCSSKSSMDWSL